MDITVDLTAFPIMTFDERQLTPAFGYVFNAQWLDPQESIVGMLWKFARMNALAGHVIARQLAKCSIDPYEGVPANRKEVDMRRLRDTLGVQLKLVRSALLPNTLDRISSPYFRFCPKCQRHGYHSVVHQLETVQHCPIHGDWLQVACPGCGQPTRYRLNASLLDAPFRCATCSAFYGASAPQFMQRRPLNLRERSAVTRLKLHYYSS